MSTDARPENTTGSELVASVERMARLSDQAIDRQRLMKAVPSVVAFLDDSINAFKPTPEQLDQALSQIWPANKLINELDDDFVHQHFEDVKIFGIEVEGFDRNMKIAPDMVAIKGVREDTSTDFNEVEDDDEFTTSETNTYIDDGFVVISPKVALKYQTVCGDYCDEDWDATLTGEILVSENPQQMQAMIRHEMRAFSSEEAEEVDLEEKMSKLFSSAYVPPAAKSPKP